MSNSKIRLPLLMGAMLAAALPVYSQQSTSSAPPAKPSEETVKKAKSLGLRPEVSKGVTRYCVEDANTGTRFPTKKCWSEIQLDDAIAQRQAMQDDMRRMITNGGSK